MIFVNIASYRDPECQPTIDDMFRKARHPDRIVAGIVLQVHPTDGIQVSHPRARITHVHAAESKGACWARSLGYKLWEGEEFVLQIDSHMRFAPDWDVQLLEELAACPSSKPLLTTYPPAFEPPDNLLTDKAAFLAAKRFDEHGILYQQGIMEHDPVTPKPTAFVAAGYLFGRSTWIRDVPYDPNIYFNGEEATLAARLWTHGWDMFGPTKALIWHQYSKIVRNLHWDDNRDWSDLNGTSLSRVRQILRMLPHPHDKPVDLDPYGLGTARTLTGYQRMAGVDFRAMTIAPHALAGNFETPPCYDTAVSDLGYSFVRPLARSNLRLRYPTATTRAA